MIEALNQIAYGWWQWMLSMFWQVSLLIILIAGIDMAIRRWAWPQVRYVLWLLVLLKLVIPPSWQMETSIISRIKPGIEAKIFTRVEKPDWMTAPEKSFRSVAENPSKPTTDEANEESRSDKHLQSDPSPISANAGVQPNEYQPVSQTLPSSSSRQSAESTVSLSLQSILLIVWIAGILIFFSMLTLKMSRLRKWHQMQDDRNIPPWFHHILVQTAQRLELNKIPAIVFARDAVTPAVYGLFRPVLLLPKGYFDRLSREEAEHVLLHELCHLKRGDLWMHGICLLLQVIYWFNPLLIWMRRQMKHVREICCDLSVANVLREETSGYRDTLLNTARELLTETVEPGLGLLGVFEEPFRLVTRLRWLEKKTWENRKQVLLVSIISSLLIVACFMPMAGLKHAAIADVGETGAPEKNVAITRLSGDNYSISKEPEAKSTTKEFTSLKIKIKKTKPFTAVILPKVGDPDILFESAMEELLTLAKQQKIKTAGDPFSRAYRRPDKVAADQLSWEVGIPVKEGTTAKAPLEIIKLPSQQVASTQLIGQFDTESTWMQFVERVSDMGLVPCFPPSMEVYPAPPKNKPFWWNTELQIQAFRPGAGYPGMQIEFKEIGPSRAILLPVQGSYGQYPEALDRLRGVIRKNKLPTKKQMIGLHYSNPEDMLPSEYYWEVGCVLEADARVVVDEPFEIRDLNHGQYATCVMSVSPDHELPWAAFIIQTLLTGYMPIGAMSESWQENPHRDGDLPSEVEMRLPVMKIDGFAEGMESWGKVLGKLLGATDDADQTVDQNTKVNPGRDQESPGSISLPIGFKEVNPFWAVVLPVTGSYSQHEQSNKRLIRYLVENHIAADSLFGQYFNGPDIREDELKWRVGVKVDHKVSVEKPFECVHLDRQTVAYIVHVGAHEEVRSEHWEVFTQQLEDMEYEAAGPWMEIWHEKGGIRTEMQLPVERRQDEEFYSENWGDKIKQFFNKLSDPPKRKSIFDVETTPGTWALVHPATGTLGQLSIVFEKLDNYMRVNGIQPLGDPFIRKYNSEEVVGELGLRWEACYAIQDSHIVKAPFKVIRVPEKKVVRSHFAQSTDQKAWNIQISAWLYRNNMRIKTPHSIYFISGVPETGRAVAHFAVELEVEKLDEPLPEVAVFTRSLPGRHMLVLSMQGDLEQEDDAVQRLRKYVKKSKLNVLDDVSVRYHNSPEWTKKEDLVWEVIVPIEDDFHPEKPFQTEWQQGRLVACANYEGDHSDIPIPFWLSYTQNFSMNGYFVNGLPNKVLREKIDSETWKVELQWPVKR